MIKTDANNKLAWANGFYRFAISYYSAELGGYIDYIDKEGNFTLICNQNKRAFKDGEFTYPKGAVYQPSTYTLIPGQVITIKITVNIVDGSMKIQELIFPEHKISGVVIDLLDKNNDIHSEFLVRGMIDDKPKAALIDFE